MLTVTLSGVDETVDPLALRDLSAEFPFVEWGLLLSRSNAGTGRYPSRAWCERFQRIAANEPNLRYAGHVCGKSAVAVMNGELEHLRFDLEGIPALQINGYTRRDTNLAHRGLAGILDFVVQCPTRIILQCRNETLLDATLGDAHAIAKFGEPFDVPTPSVLFDPSGGRGLPLDIDHPTWVRHERRETWRGPRTGFAGGIGPDTVDTLLAMLNNKGLHTHWIDMESSLRSPSTNPWAASADSRFDLAKARVVLERALPFVAPSRTRDLEAMFNLPKPEGLYG